MSERRKGQEIDRRIDAVVAVMQTLYQSIIVKRGDPKSEALNLPVNLRPYLHLWSRALGSDQKKILDKSGRNYIEIISLGWPGNTLVLLGQAGGSGQGEKSVGFSFLALNK